MSNKPYRLTRNDPTRTLEIGVWSPEEKTYVHAGYIAYDGAISFDAGVQSSKLTLSDFANLTLEADKMIKKILKEKPKPKKRVPASKCTCQPAPDGAGPFWHEDEEARCPYHNQ